MAFSNLQKVILTAVCLMQFGLVNAYAQESETYSRVGLTVQGGYTFPGNITGARLYKSNFNRQTVSSSNQGVWLKFAVMPFWSLETGYRTFTVKGRESSPFETTVESASLRNLFNLNRLYRKHAISEVVNVYGITGFEYDFYEYQSEVDQNKGKGFSFVGGLGVELSIGYAFDVYTQYEAKFSNNRIDNISSGSKFDQIGMASAGIRFNFGRDNDRPLKHKPLVMESLPAREEPADSVHVPEPPLVQHAEEIPEVETQPEEAVPEEQHIQTEEEEPLPVLTPLIEEEVENQNMQLLLLTVQLNQLRVKVDSLKHKTEQLEARPEPVPVPSSEFSVRRRELSRGYYIQVFTAREPDNAERVKSRYQSLLKDKLDNPAEEVFTIRRGPYHEVLIGNLSRFSEINDILDIATAEFPDAFPFYIE